MLFQYHTLECLAYRKVGSEAFVPIYSLTSRHRLSIAFFVIAKATDGNIFV